MVVVAFSKEIAYHSPNLSLLYMTSKKGTSQVKTHFRNSWLYTYSSQFTSFFPKKNHVKQELHKWRKNINNILYFMILTQKPHNVLFYPDISNFTF